MRLTQEQIKKYYSRQSKPQILEIPKMKYITIEGQGNPNHQGFADDVSALYAITYPIKMSYKRLAAPKGYYDYKIFPLEGVWDLVDYTKPSTDKENYKYTLMIQQPDFVDQALFDAFQEEAIKKGKNPFVSKVTYQEMTEGLVCQMLHKGPFETEDESFKLMEAYCEEQGCKRVSKLHKEIYLSDPRRSKPENLKTILRFQVESLLGEKKR